MLLEKSVDTMKSSQDIAQNPLSLVGKESQCQRIKELGAQRVAVSAPYDVPTGYPDPDLQTHEWVIAATKFNLDVHLRKSWASDEGWYGVPKQTTNNRIQDTVSWIKAYHAKYPDDLKHVKIFTPKPEPQNMGIQGISTGSNARFASKSAFNVWLRDMTTACRQAFTEIGLTPFVGDWGFDGFIVCGYNNPDWEGKSFLETATVQQMGRIAFDHYPSVKPMSDFLRVLHLTWPGVRGFAGEYGSNQDGDKIAALKESVQAIKDDPLIDGLNYWQLGPQGKEALLNTDLTINDLGKALQEFYIEAPAPEPESNIKFVHKAGTAEYGFLEITPFTYIYYRGITEQDIEFQAVKFGINIWNADMTQIDFTKAELINLP